MTTAGTPPPPAGPAAAAPRSRWRGLAPNLALLALVLAACLALTELGLRLAVGNANTTVLYEPDPLIIARMRPNLDTVLPDPFTGERVRLRTDARGDRIGDDAAPPPDGGGGGARRPRIVVYGDSNVAALYTAYANTYPARLAERLGGPGAVEVVNAGIYGGGPDQSLLRMEREWDQVRPDLVVFQLFLDNDFGDLLRNRLLRVGEGGRLERIPRDRPDPAFGRMRRLEAGYLTVRYLRQAATLLRGALHGGGKGGGGAGGLRPDSMGIVVETAAGTVPAPDYIALQLRRAAEEVERYKAGPPISWFYDHYEYDLALEPDGEGARLKRELMRAVLAEARRFAAERGGRILFLVEPSSRDMTQNLPIGPRELAAFSPAYRPRASEEFVGAALAGLGAEAVRLWEPFERAGPAKVYLVGDDHWNPAGMDLAAAETARRLRERWPELLGGSS